MNNMEKAQDDDLLRWYKARDLLLGLTRVPQDFAAAVEMARTSKHPDAMWLCRVLADCPMDYRCADLLRAYTPEDPRALCFAGKLGVPMPGGIAIDCSLLKRAALQHEYPLALRLYGQFGDELSREERDAVLSRAAALEDPHALYLVGISLAEESDKRAAMMQRAAELGNPFAQLELAKGLDVMDLRRYELLLRAQPVSIGVFDSSARTVLLRYLEDGNDGDLILRIADLVAKQHNRDGGSSEAKKSHYLDESASTRDLEKALLHMRTEWNVLGRSEVDSWNRVALRLPIVKDIRRYIAQLVWQSRASAPLDISSWEKRIRGPQYFL